jgi:hypothetical protein
MVVCTSLGKNEDMNEHESNLRDLAAMFAMNGLIARESSGAFDFAVHPQDPWRVAQWAYDVADQMMRVRLNKEQPPKDFGIASLKPRRKKAE